MYQYDQALNKSNELRSMRDNLLKRRNTFSNDDMLKLSRLVPDNVDNIRLIIDINNIATRHGLALTKVQLGSLADIGTASNAAAGLEETPLGSVVIGFSVSANYDNFLAFLRDLESGLRIVDVEKISFKSGLTDANTYDLDVRTYWLH